MSTDSLLRWWPDIVCVALGIVFLNGAITGSFYTHKRGGGHVLIAKVRSAPFRMLFLVLAVTLFVWVVYDARYRLRLHAFF